MSAQSTSTVEEYSYAKKDNISGYRAAAKPLTFVSDSLPRYKRLWTVYVSERRLLLMFVDLVLLNAALLASLLMRSFQPTFRNETLAQLINFLVLTALWLIIARAIGSYNLRRAASPFVTLFDILQTGLLTAGSYLIVVSVVPFQPFEFYRVQWVFIVLCGLLIGVWRLFYSLALNQPAFSCNALAVGDTNGINFINKVINEHLKSEYKLYEYNLETRLSPQMAQASDSNPSGLMSFVRRNNVQEIILSNNSPLTKVIQQDLIHCYEQGIRIVSLPLLCEDVTGRIPLDCLKYHWHITITNSHPYDRIFDISKRLIDIILSLAAILILLPIAFVLSIIIYLDSAGHILYRQKRIGKHGRPFYIIKFRSMVANAEQDNQAIWAKKNDSRITRVGKFMRRTHLDEIPQFFNILRGDMSCVGPRPERPQFVQQLEKQVPLRAGVKSNTVTLILCKTA